MPYIEKALRAELDAGRGASQPGELAYVLFRLLHGYRAARGESFQTYAEIIGVLEAVKAEFYRRSVAQYEDRKLVTNGDVL